MTIFQGLFKSPIWKWIALTIVSALVLAIFRFLATLEQALEVLRQLTVDKGLDLPAEVVEIVAWGKYSATILICLALFGLLDLVAYVRRTRQYSSVTEVIKQFAAGNFELRAPNVSSREVAGLSKAFNSMADQIVQNIDTLKNTDALRRELVANVAHDLGGPVTSIQGFVETILLKDPELSNEDRRRYLNIILSNTKSLSKLVEELFDLSKLDSNVVALKPQEFSLVTLSDDIASRYSGIARNKGVELEVVRSSGIPLVEADIGLIERVISNIIDNAIKFTPPRGSVTVSCSSSNGKVKLTVKDTGIGIPKEDLPFILERFYRVGKDRSRSTGGTGLGLAIVKKILDLHDTNLSVVSELNSGTAISFTLPALSTRCGEISPN